MLKTLIYIVSISFQLAGALILVKRFNPRKVKEQVLKEVEEDRSKSGAVWHTFGESGIQHTETKETLQSKAVKRQIISGGNGVLFSTISPLNGILFSVTAQSWRNKRHAIRRLIP